MFWFRGFRGLESGHRKQSLAVWEGQEASGGIPPASKLGRVRNVLTSMSNWVVLIKARS
jgi:hypothetical protein